jgi:hypothetical protein
MSLNHPNAIKLRNVATKYRSNLYKQFKSDKNMLKVAEQDYIDLMSIAIMIEENEFNNKAIARAIGSLDTIVRDTIPDNIYELYCR